MLVIILIAFGCLLGFAIPGDTCRCVHFKFLGIKLWTYAVGGCVYPNVRMCQWDSETRDCYCNSKYLVTDEAVFDSVEVPMTPAAWRGLHLPDQTPVAAAVHQEEDTFDFIVDLCCQSVEGSTNVHADDLRRLQEELGGLGGKLGLGGTNSKIEILRRSVPTSSILQCLGGYLPEYVKGIKCHTRRLDIDDYKIPALRGSRSPYVDLDKHLSTVGHNVERPEVCRLTLDCQILERMEEICNTLSRNYCGNSQFNCYWGEFGEQ